MPDHPVPTQTPTAADDVQGDSVVPPDWMMKMTDEEAEKLLEEPLPEDDPDC